MRRLSTLGLALIAVVGLCAPAAFAGDRDQTVSARLGIPTDVLMNLTPASTYDLYAFGAALEGSYGVQIARRFILGGVAGYGFGKGDSVAVPDYRHYLWAAGRFGFGSLAGLSGSLIAGVVYVPAGGNQVIPDLGISVDWRFLSLGLSTGCVSLGATLQL